MINILWQEVVGGGGIGRPLDGALHGAEGSSILCRVQRSGARVASLLTHKESHFSDPSRGIWREYPFIGGDNDAMV